MSDELNEYERLIEGINQIAGIVRAYYVALVEKGFTDEQAMKLSAEYQNSILRSAFPRKE